MSTSQASKPAESSDDAPMMGTLEAKFLTGQTQKGIQFPNGKTEAKQNHASPKTKKKKNNPTVGTPVAQQAPSSARKRVSFSPGVISTINYTYSKQEYDRTPIMGIFNHFCDCCQSGIEGARFHCRLCPDFDMCQTCFLTQGAKHIHGQKAFTCPELDEIEALNEEGEEGDDVQLDLQEYLAAAMGDEGDVDEGDIFDDFPFGVIQDEGDDDDEAIFIQDDGEDDDLPQPSVRLADENGELERITPEEAAKLKFEAEPSLDDLFPKFSAPLPTQPTLTPTSSQPADSPKAKKPKKKKAKPTEGKKQTLPQQPKQPQPQAQKQQPQAQKQKPQAQKQEPQAQKQQPQPQNQQPQAQKQKAQPQKPQVQTQKPQAQTQKPQARTQQAQTQRQVQTQQQPQQAQAQNQPKVKPKKQKQNTEQTEQKQPQQPQPQQTQAPKPKKKKKKPSESKTGSINSTSNIPNQGTTHNNANGGPPKKQKKKQKVSPTTPSTTAATAAAPAPKTPAASVNKKADSPAKQTNGSKAQGGAPQIENKTLPSKKRPRGDGMDLTKQKMQKQS